MKHIKKIKFNPSKWPCMELHFTQQKDANSTSDDIVLKSHNYPHPDFEESFQRLRGVVLTEAEITGSFNEEDVTVTGVTLTDNDDKGLGAVVSASIKLSGSASPLNINTPHKVEEPVGDIGDLHTDSVEALYELIDEAVAYLGGKLAQANMEFAAEEPNLLESGDPAADQMADEMEVEAA